MKIDIPKLVSEAQLTYPEVSLHMHSHAIGSSNDVIRAATDPLVRIGAHSSQGSKTGILFVGRGSRDATAYQTFHDVANRIAEEQHIPTSQYTCAFLAGMGSRFEQGLTTLHAAGNERLIVVPYLLFQGLLTNALPGQVTSWRGENVSRQQIEIVITRHLGVHSCVKEHVVGTVVGAVVEHLQYSFRA
jgi:sirohydrochlorin ferrochelatase